MAVRRKAQAQHDGAARRHGVINVVQGGLGADAFGVEAVLAVDDVPVEGVLHERAARPGAGAEDARAVGLVEGEQEAAAVGGVEEAAAQAVRRRDVGQGQPATVGDEAHEALTDGAATDERFVDLAGFPPVRPPGPGVAEPEVRQQVQRRRFRPAVERLDADAQVFRIDLGVLDENVKVSVFIEDAGVEKLELEAAAGPPLVLRREMGVGELRLRILIEILHVRMGRRVVEVEVVFLDVLAVVAFVGGESEQAFLEDGVAAVPEGGGEAEELVAVADAGDAVLAPAVGLAAGQVVRQVAPGVAVGAVVLADGGPGAFADIRPPAAPAGAVVGGLADALVFGGWHVRAATLDRFDDKATHALCRTRPPE